MHIYFREEDMATSSKELKTTKAQLKSITEMLKLCNRSLEKMVKPKTER